MVCIFFHEKYFHFLPSMVSIVWKCTEKWKKSFSYFTCALHVSIMFSTPRWKRNAGSTLLPGTTIERLKIVRPWTMLYKYSFSRKTFLFSVLYGFHCLAMQEKLKKSLLFNVHLLSFQHFFFHQVMEKHFRNSALRRWNSLSSENMMESSSNGSCQTGFKLHLFFLKSLRGWALNVGPSS